MNIKDIEYIVAVAKLGHFGKAADFCNITQPTLSMQIKKCEESLGIKIFERINKKTSITPEGEIFLEHAQVIISHFNKIREFRKSKNDPLKNKIRLGVFPTLGPFLLPLFVPRMFKKYNGIKLYLYEEKTSNLQDQLIKGYLDCALLATDFENKHFTNEDLFFDPFLVALPQSHKLVKKKYIKIEDLENENVLLLEEGHCLRAQSVDVCSFLKTPATEQFQATSLETLRYMVSTGLGITLIPSIAAVKVENLVYRPFADPQIGRQIKLVHNRKSYKLGTLEIIFNELKNLCSKYKLG